MKHPSTLLLFCIVGCSSAGDGGSFQSINQKHDTIKASRTLSYQEAKSWIANHAGRRYGTFISRGGELVGMDSDGKISFISMTEIEVTEYGYGVVTYHGTYTIGQDGAIDVRLNDYPSKWPSMHLVSKDPKTLLLPVTKNTDFNLGGRAGAVDFSDMVPYWPFVHVYSSD